MAFTLVDCYTRWFTAPAFGFKLLLLAKMQSP